MIEDDDLIDSDFLIYLSEFVVMGGEITPLFTVEEQTTITNSIRTDVTQAGLTYTRAIAWQFFIRFLIIMYLVYNCFYRNFV